jgi:hypothetical protein
METLLFKDSEVFVKERPTKLGEKQEAEIWLKIAQEVIDNDWSDNSIDDIIEDLQGLSKFDDGFEKAKDLDGWKGNASYTIDSEFVSWLDNFDSEFNDAIKENVRRWVKAHDIKPKLETGTKLIINTQFSKDPKMKVGETIYINGFYEKEAEYYVSTEKGVSRNLCVHYEKIEQCCIASLSGI